MLATALDLDRPLLDRVEVVRVASLLDHGRSLGEFLGSREGCDLAQIVVGHLGEQRDLFQQACVQCPLRSGCGTEPNRCGRGPPPRYRARRWEPKRTSDEKR